MEETQASEMIQKEQVAQLSSLGLSPKPCRQVSLLDHSDHGTQKDR